MISENFLQIGQISTGFVDVPGQISINIYAQGCSNRCPGCQNQNLLSFDGGYPISTLRVKDIINKYSMANWICWLGGDAVYQEDSFRLFNKEFKKFGKKVCLYTGKLFEEIEYLLDDVDVVIDGPYIESLGGVSSSTTNQRIFLKTSEGWKRILSFPDLKTKLKET